MNTNKINKVNLTEKVSKAIETVKTTATKANNYALNTTEEAVTETLNIVDQWQKVTDKALKAGVKLLDNQQNLIFDSLETYKDHFVKGKKRFSKLFA
ncbi:MAG: hypothetical protein WAO74_11825 [Polaribacter sp.]|uniref:hypothetical protein n=1 Tax=Polaribacter sp. TaxID=1920175 RepID=UPI003BAEAC2E